jgi:hypothetical protein
LFALKLRELLRKEEFASEVEEQSRGRGIALNRRGNGALSREIQISRMQVYQVLIGFSAVERFIQC